MKFKDIPQFPFASYRVNIGWTYLQSWLKEHEGNTLYELELNPEYQRGYVWQDVQKTAYIEYQLQGGFSGRDIFWNCPRWMNWKRGETALLELVDGKQRIDAVLGFLNDEVKAFGLLYSEFDGELGFNPDFIFHINNLTDRKEIIKWYLGINKGGSVHTENDLRPAYELLKTL